MTDYMLALYARFCIPSEVDVETQKAIESARLELLKCLSKPECEILMRMIDSITRFCDELAFTAFTAGYKLADGIRLELAETGTYSFIEEDEVNSCQERKGGAKDAL